MLVTKVGMVLPMKHYFKQRTIQNQVQIRFVFPQRPKKSKIVIQKIFQSTKQIVHVLI